MGEDIRHPAPHGLEALGGELLLVHCEGPAENGKVRVEEEGPVVEEPPFVHVLGAPRKLPPVDGQVVPAVELGFYTELFQGPNHRHGVPGEVEGGALVVGHDEGVIQVSQVMVDRPSAGDPPDHADSPFLHECPVHLLGGVLEAPHDDGGGILPEQEVPGVSPVHGPVEMLLHGQVECRVVALPLDVVHGILSSQKASCQKGRQASLYKISCNGGGAKNA